MMLWVLSLDIIRYHIPCCLLLKIMYLVQRVSVLCGRSKKLPHTSPQCSCLLLGLLKVLELVFFKMLKGLLRGVRYFIFPRCPMHQLNKTEAEDLIIYFCFTSFNGSGSHFVRPARLPNYLNCVASNNIVNLIYFISLIIKRNQLRIKSCFLFAKTNVAPSHKRSPSFSQKVCITTSKLS